MVPINKMKRYLLKLLLWAYRKVIKDFTKVSSSEEFDLYKFGNPSDVIKLIRYLQTANIMWMYESKTEEERLILKGSSMMLKILLDSHNEVMEIIEHCSDENKQIEYWNKFKIKNKTS